MKETNLARRFTKKHAGHIVCEPSGRRYKDLNVDMLTMVIRNLARKSGGK